MKVFVILLVLVGITFFPVVAQTNNTNCDERSMFNGTDCETVCPEGTYHQNDVCVVINPTSAHEGMSQGDTAFFIGMILLFIVIVVGVLYYRKLGTKNFSMRE